jgi:NADH-quinone oxidoreductase subunit L
MAMTTTAPMLNPNLLLWVPLAPLVGCILAGLFGKAIGRRGAHMVTILGVAIAAVISLMTLKEVIAGARFSGTLYEWMVIGGLKMEIGFLVDGLTAMMMVVVTSVSLMVHIYTIGYMADDPGYQRFFSLHLAVHLQHADAGDEQQLLQLFFGWEAVGLVSYLLIGFWYTRPTAIFANMKAFLVNRVGDFGFILGIGLLLAHLAVRSNYAELFPRKRAGADRVHDRRSGAIPGC